MEKLTILFLVISHSAFSQKKEAWIDKPFSEWPQIALVNEVLYKNGDSYIDPGLKKTGYAGTGFLIDTGKDTLAATAKHILWVAKNVNSKGVVINKDLKSWIMHPKNNGQDRVEIDSLINEDKNEILDGREGSIMERDWIVFSVKKNSRNITPLKPRYTALLPGEKVYRLGNPYDSPVTVVYESKVVRTEGNDIYLETDTTRLIGGGSGSPIIDANGFVVGIMSSVFNDTKSGNLVEMAISIQYVKDVLEKKSGLNTPKKTIYDEMLKRIETQDAKKAIVWLKNLRSDKKNYYTYTLRMAHFELSRLGKKLIETGKVSDAVKILEYNSTIGLGHFPWVELGDAYLLTGNKVKAKKAYEKSLTLKKNREAEDALRKLSSE
jgi:hypothetical protein